MSDSLVEQGRWDQSYEDRPLEHAAASDAIRRWIEHALPPGTGSCLELGCYPGRYLSVFGDLGYELHGIDLTPQVAARLPDWLAGAGYRVGSFTRADLLQHPFARKYDVVCSFGLLEHFIAWRELLRLHAALVEPGGWLVVSSPNFRGGLQRWLHGWLDAGNLAEHNFDAMQPYKWAKLVRRLGFKVVTAGFIGPFDFWVGPAPRSRVQQTTLRAIERMTPLARRLPDDVGFYAPYCGMIARKQP